MQWAGRGGRGGLSSAGGLPGHLGCCGQLKGRAGSELLVPEGAGSQAWGRVCLAERAVDQPGLGPSTAWDLGEADKQPP